YAFGCVITCVYYLYLIYYRFSFLRDLLSFPTRRSSDLLPRLPARPLRPKPCCLLPVRNGTETRSMRTSKIRMASCWLTSIMMNPDRKSTRLNSSHVKISYAVFCLKKKKKSNKGLETKVM